MADQGIEDVVTLEDKDAKMPFTAAAAAPANAVLTLVPASITVPLTLASSRPCS